MQPTTPTIVLVVFALLYAFIIRRRLGASRRNAELWFKPHGDGFIYQPRGRWGRAYLVSAEQRDRIREGDAQAVKIAILLFAAIYFLPLLLATYDPPLFRQIQPWLLPFRLGGVALAFAGVAVAHHLRVRPLYADAPLSPERITTGDVLGTLARRESWGLIVLRLSVSGGLLAVTIFAALNRPPNAPLIPFALGMLIFCWLLFRSVRLAVAKAAIGQR